MVVILRIQEIAYGDLTNVFSVTDRSNITIYLPNVKEEEAEAKGWTTFFVDESNYKEVKYGERPETANP